MPVIEENKSLKPYNTFRVDVLAKQFTEVFTEDDLLSLYQSGAFHQPYLILGGGSNMLFTKNFDGLVIKISIPGIEAEVSGTDVKLQAGAGVVWNDLVSYSVARGYAGLENLSLIPGTVGASPVQNIGAYGVELKDVFENCKVFNTHTGEFEQFAAGDCQFDYRHSIFKEPSKKGKYIITQVGFRLSTQAEINTRYGVIEEELKKRHISNPGIADVSAVVSSIRVSKLPDPSTIGNAGSFFKNPIVSRETADALTGRFPDAVRYPVANGDVKLAAGWLIEQCGFKGMVDGNTGTWKNQALVLVNHGGATGQEVYTFSERIIKEVDAKFGVKLEREVNIL
ncbi:UDP-N-acetylmuramate dehydrogenase [Pedobacter faecalis]|uniref:UDP-N-acetylmuramate dehydrogenase n=1 Tax=Pedobacter faecalis TaxID=3041495 RepID=UPI00254A16B8|nr:UDP-N-acetylmuramate dehydrogenase [Pedobacter sp. ELA7]